MEAPASAGMTHGFKGDLSDFQMDELDYERFHVKHPCDLCDNHENFLTVPGDHTGQVEICGNCGFVLVRERRSIEEIARAWDEIYAKGLYSPDWPAVKARLYYVAEWLDQTIGLKRKTLLDIGAGNGFFLDQCAARGAYVAGLDPSLDNVNIVRAKDHPCFYGWAGDDVQRWGKYDLVTLNWTLENTADCIAVLKYARDCLSPGGHVVVATGSRILVPFKKPLSAYLGSGTPPDTHCFRWTMNMLRKAARWCGLSIAETNPWEECDVMIATFQAGQDDEEIGFAAPSEVQDFFARWQREWP